MPVFHDAAQLKNVFLVSSPLKRNIMACIHILKNHHGKPKAVLGHLHLNGLFCELIFMIYY